MSKWQEWLDKTREDFQENHSIELPASVLDPVAWLIFTGQMIGWSCKKSFLLLRDMAVLFWPVPRRTFSNGKPMKPKHRLVGLAAISAAWLGVTASLGPIILNHVRRSAEFITRIVPRTSYFPFETQFGSNIPGGYSGPSDKILAEAFLKDGSKRFLYLAVSQADLNRNNNQLKLTALMLAEKTDIAALMTQDIYWLNHGINNLRRARFNTPTMTLFPDMLPAEEMLPSAAFSKLPVLGRMRRFIVEQAKAAQYSGTICQLPALSVPVQGYTAYYADYIDKNNRAFVFGDIKKDYWSFIKGASAAIAGQIMMWPKFRFEETPQLLIDAPTHPIRIEDNLVRKRTRQLLQNAGIYLDDPRTAQFEKIHSRQKEVFGQVLPDLEKPEAIGDYGEILSIKPDRMVHAKIILTHPWVQVPAGLAALATACPVTLVARWRKRERARV